MPKFPSIPRLSVVIPVGRDLDAFETSLVSVLENRPPRTEILVCHDGSYDDPFDLGDEVRFVVAPSRRLTDLIGAGAGEARGRIVHLLGEGVRATGGWDEPARVALDDPQIGIVAPLILGQADCLLAAGWGDTPAALCQPNQTTARGSGGVRAGRGGAYLQASFWRRELLRSLAGSYPCDDSIEAGYAYAWLAGVEGWACQLAADCVTRYDHATLRWDRSTANRGRRLRALHNEFHAAGWAASLAAGGRAFVGAMVKLGGFGEAFGQLTAPLCGDDIRRRLRRPSAPTAVAPPTLLPMHPASQSPRRGRRKAA